MPSGPKPILAWHWLEESRQLRYSDNRLVKVGRKLSAVGPLSLCNNGMHASIKATDATANAPGPIICRVKLTGERIEGSDKLCARTREVLWMADATGALWDHALWCAEQALPIWYKYYPEDHRPRQAIEAKRLHLAGKITVEQLSAARSAAWSAAESAAWSAAESAAWSAERSAAKSAAWSAAWSAAKSAAWSAAKSAAWSAARSAARSAQEKDLTDRLMALAPKK